MRSTGVHHLDLVVSELGRSLRFYRELLGPVCWDTRRRSSASVASAWSTSGDPAPRSGCGRLRTDHVALEVPKRADVEACAERLIVLGARITDGPRRFSEYPADYYGVFFRDPDGLKLEIVSQEPRS